MTVAIQYPVMKWTEIATIYFALGAPFAAARFLAARVGRSRRQRFVELMLTAIGWPVAGAGWLLRRSRHVTPATVFADADDLAERADTLKRRVLIALSEMRDLEIAGHRTTDVDRALIAIRLRESVEQYVGLSQVEPVDSNRPAQHEVEFFRVAGRRAADLATAANCLHRRNTARLERHRSQARADLLHGLAAMRGAGDTRPRLTLPRGARPTDQAMSSLYKATSELFILFKDPDAAVQVQAFISGEKTAALDPEEIPCNTPTPTQPVQLLTQR
ncbi:MAG: hypothetical protein ABIZ95_21085 [Pyrinomonadaceae bacterium]